MTRMLRAIRFDTSDKMVFPKAADENEWLLPGGFVFSDEPYGDPALLTGKERQAFVSGFLAIGSFGFSTFASVAEASEEDLADCEDCLAAHLISSYGAPNDAAARQAASAEIGFARELADGAALNTLLALKREIGEDGGIKESFHIVTPPGDKPHTRVWDVVEEL